MDDLAKALRDLEPRQGRTPRGDGHEVSDRIKSRLLEADRRVAAALIALPAEEASQTGTRVVARCASDETIPCLRLDGPDCVCH